MNSSTELRAAFARRLSAMYGGEVPLYTTLVEVAHEVNAAVLARQGAAAERLGSIDRVTAERHGAIRVGTADELRQVGQLFAAMGMHPVGFYDLRDAGAAAVPVVSTAFRPVDPAELAVNPFRVFVSVLVTDDRRFFDESLQADVESFLARRNHFPPELMDHAAPAERDGGLAFEVEANTELGKVSLIGAGMRSHPGVAATMFRTLAELGINLEMISTSPIKISCMIARDRIPEAVRGLHGAFALEREPEREPTI